MSHTKEGVEATVKNLLSHAHRVEKELPAYQTISGTGNFQAGRDLIYAPQSGGALSPENPNLSACPHCSRLNSITARLCLDCGFDLARRRIAIARAIKQRQETIGISAAIAGLVGGFLIGQYSVTLGVICFFIIFAITSILLDQHMDMPN